MNKPDVRETFGLHVAPDYLFDMAEVCQRADYLVAGNGTDAFMLADMQSPVLFECHSVFDTTCRGRNAIRVGKELIAWMWQNTAALMLYGKTPVELKAARWFNRQVGFTSDGIVDWEQASGINPHEFFHISRPA